MMERTFVVVLNLFEPFTSLDSLCCFAAMLVLCFFAVTSYKRIYFIHATNKPTIALSCTYREETKGDQSDFEETCARFCSPLALNLD